MYLGAYISFGGVSRLGVSHVTIDRATSCRLLKYIRSAATVPRPVTLHCAFFFTTDT